MASNAAIEAARACEHGRGFSVVAAQVRRLSDRTQDALGDMRKPAEQVRNSVGSLTEDIEGVLDSSTQSESVANDVLEQFSTVTSLSAQALEEIENIATQLDGLTMMASESKQVSEFVASQASETSAYNVVGSE